MPEIRFFRLNNKNTAQHYYYSAHKTVAMQIDCEKPTSFVVPDRVITIS